jgi:hypothetical protein
VEEWMKTVDQVDDIDPAWREYIQDRYGIWGMPRMAHPLCRWSGVSVWVQRIDTKIMDRVWLCGHLIVLVFVPIEIPYFGTILSWHTALLSIILLTPFLAISKDLCSSWCGNGGT